MASDQIDDRAAFLLTLPARQKDRRLALSVLLVSVVIFLAAAPFAKTPLQQVPAFLPIYQSVLVTNDLITAILLFGQFNILRSRPLIILASAFLFSALMAVMHALSFPGLFAPAGLIGAGPQTTAWLYFLWHGTFPLLVIAYALIKRQTRTADWFQRNARMAIVWSVTATFALVLGFTLFTTSGQGLLPAIMEGNRDAPAKVIVATASWVLCIVALLVLWRRRPHSVLDLWLIVVMCVWLFDIALSAVLNSARYDLGWYAGRIYGLLAASFVLLVLLLENGLLHARLEQAHGLRRAQLMAKLAHVITRPDGSFESWSESLPALIGADHAKMPKSTREWLNLLHAQDRTIFRDTAIEAGSKVMRADIEYRLRRADHTWIHVKQVMEPIEGEDTPDGRRRWFNTIQDITKQKEEEAKISRLNRVYAVLSGINGLIVRQPDRKELFKEACRIAVEDGKFPLAWIGIVQPGETRIGVVASAGGAESYLSKMPMALDSDTLQAQGMAGMAMVEKRAMVANDIASDPRMLIKKEALEQGFRSLVMLPLFVAGKPIGVLALYGEQTGFFDEVEMKLLLELAGDISFALEHIEKAEKLNYLASYDPLTGLANRSLLHERLTQQVLAARRAHGKFAVLFLDLDRFKTINDTLGRQAGDSLLKEVAERLTHVTPHTNSVARVGADHFAIVIPELEHEDELARLIDERDKRSFGKPFTIEGHELLISAKVGVAVFPSDGEDAETLFKNAEAALQKAKQSGDRYLFYTQEMTERVAEKLALENKLRQALAKEEFVLHYQPKVDLSNRNIVGVEALIRWQSPELGLVPPMKFIPLLEETGLILKVGGWALGRAALDHRGWVEQGLKAPRVAVNVSPIQLRQRDFVTVVNQAIQQGIVPTGIDLEITESVIMEDIGSNIAKLHAIRTMGMSIAIDDFGTGYSSLAYLAKLPVETLKIDRSFVITMLDDPNTMTLVRTMISLAHSLRLKVIAEGVDAEEQANVLRLLGCDEMQGYLFSKPLPLEGITALLKRSS